MNDKMEYIDKMAGQAMQAMISKLPMYDVENEFGKGIPKNELATIKEHIALSAYEYAQWMYYVRHHTEDWLKKQ